MFYSEEGHEPPHIHVRTAEKRAKFWLNPVELVRSWNYNSSELNEIRRIIEANEQDLLERWNGYFQQHRQD